MQALCEQAAILTPVDAACSLLPALRRINDELVMRAYTPTSSDDELGHFDLVIKVYWANEHPRFPGGGKMSQHLESLPIGGEMEVKGPLGHFHYLGKARYTDFLACSLPQSALQSHACLSASCKLPVWASLGVRARPAEYLLRHVPAKPVMPVWAHDQM